MFSHLLGIIEGYSLWINFNANNYGICMECYIPIARSKGGCSDLKGIVREFFNATWVIINTGNGTPAITILLLVMLKHLLWCCCIATKYNKLYLKMDIDIVDKYQKSKCRSRYLLSSKCYKNAYSFVSNKTRIS